jgi:hypothetical protein
VDEYLFSVFLEMLSLDTKYFSFLMDELGSEKLELRFENVNRSSKAE